MQQTNNDHMSLSFHISVDQPDSYLVTNNQELGILIRQVGKLILNT